MKLSLDGRCEGTDGCADWVDAWSEDYGLTARIDACLLGGRMYPGYESYWSAIQSAPHAPLPMSSRLAQPAELAWAEFAQRTPHDVLSTSLQTATWPHTRLLRHTDDVAALKQQPGQHIYLMGGAQLTTSLIDAGLVDELHLICYPLIAGPGKPLFTHHAARRPLQPLQPLQVRQLGAGRIGMAYAVG